MAYLGMYSPNLTRACVELCQRITQRNLEYLASLNNGIADSYARGVNTALNSFEALTTPPDELVVKRMARVIAAEVKNKKV